MLLKTLRRPKYEVGLMLLLAALALTGCSSTSTPESAPAPVDSSYSSPQEIVDALQREGIDVSRLKSAEPGSIPEVGGESWDLEIDRRDADINIFPTSDALGIWVEMSKSIGGIAVTGDIWAVSLEPDADDPQASLELAPRVVEAIGGTVQK